VHPASAVFGYGIGHGSIANTQFMIPVTQREDTAQERRASSPLSTSYYL
jgi:hypothetical protein